MIDNTAAIGTIKTFSLYLTTLASGVGIGAQLQVTHPYIGVDLPLWVFLVATIILIFTGALLSGQTDTMKSQPGDRTLKLFTAIMVGIIVTFIILPLIITKPNPIWLMFTGFVSGFSGTVILYLSGRLIMDKELHEAVLEVIKNIFKETLGLATHRVIAAIKVLFGSNNK